MTTLTPRRAGGVVLAAVATLVASAIYYAVFGTVWQRLRGGASATPELWTIAVQLGRNALVAFVLATLLRRLSITRTRDALRLGVLVWLGFQAMEVLGSVLHEHYPFGLSFWEERWHEHHARDAGRHRRVLGMPRAGTCPPMSGILAGTAHTR